jgi:glyoxylase-like metal-dependent hydrolase (beta-lactamase superfamily II)
VIEEILPNLYRTEIPLPNSPLKWLNSYIVKGKDRVLIIDTGFNRDECLSVMNASLQKLGVDLNKTDFFITHCHSDHMGLIGTLASDNAKVYFNEREAKRIYAQRAGEDHLQKIQDAYIANGFAAEGARISMESHPARKYSSKRNIDFSIVNDGDVIDIGDFHFRCVVTPGHSPGHTCLYEPEKKILVAGDHILFDITPNITYWVDMEDSLGKYLDSLKKVNALDVELVLTGHRRLVHDLPGRVKELQEHHRARLNEVVDALSDGEKNILQIAPHISWNITSKTWEEFPAQQKWFAFGETMAHVKYLEGNGRVQRKNHNGTMAYSLA